MNTLSAIRHLQKALTARFGTGFATDTGRGTLQIAHDRVELNGRDCVIEARGPARVARVVRRKRRATTGGK